MTFFIDSVVNEFREPTHLDFLKDEDLGNYEFRLTYWRVFPAATWYYIQLKLENTRQIQTVTTSARSDSLILPVDFNTGVSHPGMSVPLKWNTVPRNFIGTVYGEGLGGIAAINRIILVIEVKKVN